MAEEYLTPSTAAEELEKQLGWIVNPRHITLVFYYRDVPGDRAPVIGGRRIIHRDLLPAIANALRKHGWYRPVGRIPA
ncbi:MAG: hypothetical protein ABSG67_05655 [Thermoguttaceae bacterium]|jgi:hypothetical protein